MDRPPRAGARPGRPGQRGEPEILYLTQDELRRLFSVIKDKRDRALFWLAYHHGLRASEVGFLQRPDLDLKQGRISIHRIKGSVSMPYSLQPDDVKRIRSYLRGRSDSSPYLFVSNRTLPISRFMLWRLMQEYARRVGLAGEKGKFHSLRHSIAVHLLDAGADIHYVKDRLGHKNIQNTMIYARYTTTTRDALTRKLFASPKVL